MNLDVTEIRPKLYIGSRDAASQTKQLAILGVKHVLSVGTEFPSKLGVPALLEEKHLSKRKVDGRSSGGRMYLQDGGKKDPFVRLFVPIDDMGSVDIAQYFDDVRLFISEGLAQGKVLVHCVEGRSRSVALAVSSLMHKEKISVGKALLSVKEKRPTVSPKPGFIGQLLALEEQLGIEPASPRTAEAAGALKKDTDSSNPRVFLEISLDGQSIGRLEIELYADIVPQTVENFRCLCTGEWGRGPVSGKRLTYLGSVFHCIIPGFVCIGGDITRGDGTGGESIYGHAFQDENFEVKHDSEGIVSMANSGPDSNGSQFLICCTDCPQLDGKNVAFGKVVSGMEAVRMMEDCGSADGTASKRVTILDSGEVPQPGRAVKRARRDADAVATVLQILRKHEGCKKASSWRQEVITCSQEEARKQLQSLRQMLSLASGSDLVNKFEELAGEHSDCKSAKRGGRLDPFEKGMMSKAFEEAAFALPVGGLSEVFSTKQGEHLLLRLS